MSTIEVTTSYVYMVMNKNTGQWYIGKQGNPKTVIGFNYFTSSDSNHPVAVAFRESFSRDSIELDDWEVFILYQGEDYGYVEEYLVDIMGLYHPKNNPLSLNFGNQYREWSRHGTVTVYDYVSGESNSISQEEYYQRKDSGEVVTIMQYPATLAKFQATCMERYGVPHPFMSPEVQDKIRATLKERYGGGYPWASPEIMAKVRETCTQRYGFPHPMQSPEIRAKAMATNEKNLGVPNPMQSPEVRAKAMETCEERYGVKNPSQSPEIQKKKEETSLKNYGVNHSVQAPEVKAKITKSINDRFGVPYMLCLKSMLVVAYIVIDQDDVYPIGLYPSLNQASRTTLVALTDIHNVVRSFKGKKHAGVYDFDNKIFVKSNLKKALPSEAHPNLYRVKWMRLEDFQQTHPTVPLPSMEPPANDSQYIAPELSANL